MAETCLQTKAEVESRVVVKEKSASYPVVEALVLGKKRIWLCVRVFIPLGAGNGKLRKVRKPRCHTKADREARAGKRGSDERLKRSDG